MSDPVECLIDAELMEKNDRTYLDHAGATIAPKSLLSAAFADLLTYQTHGNPHSHSAYEDILVQARAIVLSHFHASPDVYDVIFTSGATQSLKIVAETFNFGEHGVFYHPVNVHTSVLGMRVFAPSTQSFPSSLLYRSHEVVTSCDHDSTNLTPITKYNLVAIPGECNFSGAKCSLLSAARMAVDLEAYLLFDAAKLAATCPVHLDVVPTELQPHFLTASFYKIFGYPTGLGVLLVKKREGAVALKKRYFGGGTIDGAAADTDWVSFRTTLQDSMTDGTPHYQGIMAIRRGVEAVVRLGGMAAIQRHSCTLARDLATRLRELTHTQTGLPLCTIFGRHWDQHGDCDDEGGFDSYTARQGPVVTFTMRWQDKSPVAHTEVSVLAAAEGIFIRSGCFCNPGACQEALGLSEGDVKANMSLGRTCAGADGRGDIINGKQTGAVRVSLGWCSKWVDCDRFVSFLQRHFLDRSPSYAPVLNKIRLQSSRTSNVSSLSEAHLQDIYVYPIKSCGGIQVTRWPLTSAGLLLDREWAIVNAAGFAMTQKNYPMLALLKPSFLLQEGLMVLQAPSTSRAMEPLVVSLREDLSMLRLLQASAVHACDGDEESHIYSEQSIINGELKTSISGSSVGVAPFHHVKVCGHPRKGGQGSSECTASEWLSKVMGESCFFMRREAVRSNQMQSDREWGAERQEGAVLGSFANEADFLLVNAASVQLHSQQMQAEFSANFRPNFVIEGAPAYSEDLWKIVRFVREDLTFNVTGQCQRCSVINVNGSTGVIDGRALASLANYRRNAGSSAINFGLFLKETPETQMKVKSDTIENRVVFIYKNCRIQVVV